MNILKIIFGGICILLALELGLILGLNIQRPTAPPQAVLPEIIYPTPTVILPANTEPVPAEIVQEAPPQVALVEIVQEPLPEPRRQSFWHPLEEVLQAIVVPQYEPPAYVAPAPPADTPIPTLVPAPATPTPFATEYVYYPGITPLTTVEGQTGAVANALPPAFVMPAECQGTSLDELWDNVDVDGCVYPLPSCSNPIPYPGLTWQDAKDAVSALTADRQHPWIIINVSDVQRIAGRGGYFFPGSGRVKVLEEDVRWKLFSIGQIQACNTPDGKPMLYGPGLQMYFDWLYANRVE